MAWWESEEQTKQKKKAHRARNWGDPDKGYGVGGGRGPGPGRYQKKDYSFPEIRAGASSSAARWRAFCPLPKCVISRRTSSSRAR